MNAWNSEDINRFSLHFYRVVQQKKKPRPSVGDDNLSSDESDDGKLKIDEVRIPKPNLVQDEEAEEQVKEQVSTYTKTFILISKPLEREHFWKSKFLEISKICTP